MHPDGWQEAPREHFGERALGLAVLEQALRDIRRPRLFTAGKLSEKQKQKQRDGLWQQAYDFLFSDTPDHKVMRNGWCQMAGVDVAWLQEQALRCMNTKQQWKELEDVLAEHRQKRREIEQRKQERQK